jgi:uncharacterized protein (DUF2235 family)
MTTNHTPTFDQLKRGLQIAEEIAALEVEMKAIFQGKAVSAPSVPHAPAPIARRRKKLSAQAIANIRAAQHKRWAKIKGAKAPVAAKAPAKKKGGLTPAGRARLAAAMKRRWAAAKKSGGPAPTAKR